MRFTLNCSKTLARVLKRTSGLSLERLVEPDTARIGTQSIFSEPESLSWQCQYVSTSYQSDSGYVIAVEAHSRYAIVLPFLFPPSCEEIDQALKRRWAEEVRLWHAIVNDSVETIAKDDSIERALQVGEVDWVLNTDMSVNGHVADTGQWARQEIDDHRGRPMTECRAMELGVYLNNSPRKASASRRQSDYFIPIERLLMLLSDEAFQINQEPQRSAPREVPDNVVSLEAFKQRRGASI